MEETLRQLRAVVESSDPDAAFGLLETREVYDYQDNDGDLTYSLGKAIDREFFSSVRDHRERVERLRAAELEEAFTTLWQSVDADVRRELRRRGPIDRKDTYRVSLSYDEASLRFEGLTLSRARRPTTGEPPRLLNYLDGPPLIRPGSIKVHCALGGYPPQVTPRPGTPTPPPPSWLTFVDTHAGWITDALLRLVEARRFGDEMD
jgi:hypothetical protein